MKKVLKRKGKINVLSFAVKISNFMIHLLRKFKIRTRLIVSFLLISIIPLSMVGVFAYLKSSNAINSKIDTYSTQVVKQISNNMKINMDNLNALSVELILDSEAQSSLQALNGNDPSAKIKAINTLPNILNKKFSSNKISASCVILPNGNVVKTGTSVPDQEEIDRLFKSGVTSNQWRTFKAAHGSDSLGLFMQIKSTLGTQTLGTLVTTVSDSFFTDTYSDTDMGSGEGQNIFVINSDGLVLSSLTDSLEAFTRYEDTSLIKTIKQYENDDKYYFTKKIFGKSCLIVFSSINDSNMYAVCAIPNSYLSSETTSIRNSIIILALICILLALILSFIISQSISVPSNQLMGLMEQAEKGDLTIEANDTSKDEIGKITTNFNSMLRNIGQLLLKVSNLSQRVLSDSEKIAQSAAHSNNISEQTSTTIQQIAQGASDQAGDIAMSVKTLDELSKGINKVDNDMGSVGGVVVTTKKLSEDALSTVRVLSDKAAQTGAVSEKIVNNINGLNSDMKEIKKIMKVISDIAEQTNLLSLNAAIEAARAGESGRGFAVVASEVSKLAEQSKNASSAISSIIANIQTKTETTVDSAINANKIINEQIEAVQATDQAFKTIYNSMDGIINDIEIMNASVNNILSSKDKVMETFETISTASEESAATAQEVSASAQEQMASSEDLSRLANDLREMAKELSEAITVFKT